MESGVVEIDIHGMNRFEARNYIDDVLKRAKKDVCRIRVIHGYHGGNKLKDMVQKEYRNREKVLRVEIGLNPGTTDLILRELF